MVPAHGVTTILYLLEKARDAAFAREGIENVSLASSPSLRSTAMLCDGPLALAWPDFEDAVCAAAAEAGGCDALMMRELEGNPMHRSR